MKPPLPRVALRAALLALVCALGCFTNPITGSRGLNLIPDSQMNRLGAEAYAEVLAKEKLSTDRRLAGIVERAARRIADASGEQFQWEFKLVESEQVNAFCLPGGKIVVYTGILPVCETEAGLAFVLGHEVAHAIARHGAQRMTTGLILGAGLAATDLALSNSESREAILQALGIGAQVGVALPFSRGHESEADTMGLTYMARAGYDPSVAPSFWERMGKGGQAPPEFLSTHPSDVRRAQDLRQQLSEAKGIYEAADDQYGLGEKL